MSEEPLHHTRGIGCGFRCLLNVQPCNAFKWRAPSTTDETPRDGIVQDCEDHQCLEVMSAEAGPSRYGPHKECPQRGPGQKNNSFREEAAAGRRALS